MPEYPLTVYRRGWLKAEARWLADHPEYQDEPVVRSPVERDGAYLDEDEQQIASPNEAQERQW